MDDFYPRSPRDQPRAAPGLAGRISIHAPRVGSDTVRPVWRGSESKFLSTLPAWGATAAANFPRNVFAFLSTLPAWGATAAPTTVDQAG